MNQHLSVSRILACPCAVGHPGSQPLHLGPLCPYCDSELDVVGVDTVVQWQPATIETVVTGLSCSTCGYTFSLADKEEGP